VAVSAALAACGAGPQLGPDDGHLADEVPAVTQAFGTTRSPPGAPLSPWTSLTELEQARAAAWGTTFGDWEVDYEGIDSPADHVPQAFVWDNPVDDDWNEPRVVASSFSFNNPSAGFLTVDRASDMLDWNKGGVISRRDEALSKSAGFTLEWRVKLYANSGLSTLPDAFNAYYLTDDGTVYGVYLSPDAVRVGGYDNVTASLAMSTLDGFHTFRMVHYPDSINFALFVDNAATAALVGTGNTKPIGSVTNENRPMIIIGGEGAFRTHFTLDFVRYRRGAFPPDAAFSPPLTRSAPPLPAPLPAGADAGFIPGFDSFHFPYDAFAIFGPYGPNGGCTAGWDVQDGGVVYDSNGAAPTCSVRNVPGLVGRGDVTVEARLKVLPGGGERLFSFMLSDEEGTHGVVFSPGRVETVEGIKNIDYQALPLDTSQFHVYRLVRPARSMYAYLYVDDFPLPAIVDQHADASTGLEDTPDHVFLEWGWALNPGPGRGAVVIDYLRWAPTAYAPPG
jgi:hypothetical protein